MRTNRSASAVIERTHEGGRAERRVPEVELERAVLSCLLWEGNFYETGNETGKRLASLCQSVPNDRIYALAEKARSEYNLRHVPLYLLVQAARKDNGRAGLAGAMASVIQRPDELTEFLALYWANGRVPLASQVKKGLARAFVRFSRFQLAKWNRDEQVKLRDVMFLTHPRPVSPEQAETWKMLAANTLPAADTWEVALSTGKDKKETWERLLSEKKLGIMALLMNLRNMDQAGVNKDKIRLALMDTDKSRAFPYRYLSAARYAPWLAEELSQAMLQRISIMPKLRGDTHVLVDVSGSMDQTLSSKSEATRLEAASSVAVCAREICESARVFTFSQGLVEVHNVRGLPLAHAIVNSQPHGATYLQQALGVMLQKAGTPDRVIVITDEQAHDGIGASHARRGAYLVNVAPYKHGLEAKSRGWHRINGWSDRLLDYVAAYEREGVSES